MKKKASVAPKKTIKQQPKSTPVPAPVSSESSRSRLGKPLTIFIGLCLFALLGLEAHLHLKSSAKKKLIFQFQNIVAASGRNTDGMACCARAVSTDRTGAVYVQEDSSVGGKLQKFSPQGKHLGTYKPKRPEEDTVLGVAMASDSRGNLYVLSTQTRTIQVLSSDFKFLKKIDISPADGLSMAINSKDQIYLGESRGIRVLDLDGKELAKFDGGKIKVGTPSRMTVGSKDEIYILDSAAGPGSEPEVKVYQADGTPITKWLVKKLQFNPYNFIAYHPKGFVMVNDVSGDFAKGIHVYTAAGKLVGNCLVSDNTQIRMDNSSQITIDRNSGDIYVIPAFRGIDRFSWSPEAVVGEK